MLFYERFCSDEFRPFNDIILLISKTKTLYRPFLMKMTGTEAYDWRIFLHPGFDY